MAKPKCMAWCFKSEITSGVRPADKGLVACDAKASILLRGALYCRRHAALHALDISIHEGEAIVLGEVESAAR